MRRALDPPIVARGKLARTLEETSHGMVIAKRDLVCAVRGHDVVMRAWTPWRIDGRLLCSSRHRRGASRSARNGARRSCAINRRRSRVGQDSDALGHGPTRWSRGVPLTGVLISASDRAASRQQFHLRLIRREAERCNSNQRTRLGMDGSAGFGNPESESRGHQHLIPLRS